MQYKFLVPNIDQMYKEMKKIPSISQQSSVYVEKKKKKNPNLPTLILKTMQSETHIIFFGLTHWIFFTIDCMDFLSIYIHVPVYCV
jgi:hypothetical protein